MNEYFCDKYSLEDQGDTKMAKCLSCQQQNWVQSQELIQKLNVTTQVYNHITKEIETDPQEDPQGSLASQSKLISALQPKETMAIEKAITPSLVLVTGDGRFPVCFLSRFIYEDNKQLSWPFVKT